MPIRMQVPESPNANIGSAFLSGIKSGDDYAKAKSLMDYRTQELIKQYSQQQNQMSIHQLTMMKSSLGRWNYIASLEPAKRSPYIKWAQTQDAVMGLKTDALAMQAKDENFKVDIVGPMMDVLNGMDQHDYKKVAAASAAYSAGTGDPVKLESLLSAISAAKREAGSEDYRNKKLEHDENKQQGQDLKSFSLKMRSDPGYRKAEGMANKLPTMLKAIDEAGKNPIVAGNLGLLMANYATNNQRLNQVEIQGLGKGSQAIADKVSQWAQTLMSGTTTGVNMKAMKQLATILGHGASEDLENIRKDYAGAYAEQSGKSVEEAYTNLTHRPYPSEDQGKKDAVETAPSLAQEHLDKISSRVKDLTTQKMAPDEIKKHLNAKFPGLNDADFKAIGLPANTPAPAPEMPTQAPAALPGSSPAQSAPTEDQQWSQPMTPPADEGNQ